MRRCSISARARGFVNSRSGSRMLKGSLVPSLPASSLAVSVSVTSAPAYGSSLRSLTVWPTPLRVRAFGSTSGNCGGSNSGRGSGLVALLVLAFLAFLVAFLGRIRVAGGELRARFGDAVIVLELVGHLQRSAGLAF